MTDTGNQQPWWTTAVFYQLYPRSFADGNGDGTGDLVGICSRLEYLKSLGVQALWLSPFYRSPMADGGYDVADPCDVDPIFGTLADFDTLVTAAHALEIRVTVDIVPNHFSEEHPWFRAALAADPGTPDRDRFIFRPGRGATGELPPNNWPSVFGGPAWSRIADGQWYLHLFAPEQPDLNWNNPDIPAEFERVLRFWLDRGVDGFRIDVAHGMAKPAGLPDFDLSVLTSTADGVVSPSLLDIRWDRDGVHEFHRRFRRVLDNYPGEKMAVGEAWVPNAARLARYVRPDELNLTFNFELVLARWGATALTGAIERSLDAMREVGAASTWVLANHDVDRVVTRYGGGPVGLARARAAALLQIALPGAIYIYNGDELGLPNVELPDEALQDPTWERSGHTARGRDGERVPMPWSGTSAPYGFTTTDAATWLPMPDNWAQLTVSAQLADPGSTLSLYRRALALRRTFVHAPFHWRDLGESTVAFRRGAITVVLNAGSDAVALPPAEVILASAPLPVAAAAGKANAAPVLLPPDCAAWLREPAGPS